MTPEVNLKSFLLNVIGSDYIHAFKCMYLVIKYRTNIRLEPCYSAVNGYYPKLYPTIAAQSSVKQDEFAFERIFVVS